VFRDGTEQRAAKITARRLQALIENSHDGIYTRDLTGMVTSWNKGAQRMFGFTAEEVLDKPIAFIPAHREQEERQILIRIQKGEAVAPYETTRLTKDRREIAVSMSASPVNDPVSGRVIEITKIVRDIPASKKTGENGQTAN
jgi:PAS domain S-box-containing protein